MHRHMLRGFFRVMAGSQPVMPEFRVRTRTRLRYSLAGRHLGGFPNLGFATLPLYTAFAGFVLG